jgi:hypothetical protein
MRKLVIVGLLAIGASLGMADVAVAGQASWSPSTADFGRLPVGLSSAPKTFTLTAGPSGWLPNPVITNVTGFDVVSTTCGSALTAGMSCTAQVVFAPNQVGPIVGDLEGDRSGENGTLAEAEISGYGVAAAKKKCKKGFKLVKKHGKTTCKKRGKH